MNVRIESKPSFKVAGLVAKNGQNEDLPGLLTSRGYNVVKISNYFGSGGVYQGLHYVFEKNGVPFELQFHTPESFRIKSLNHYDYEAYRSVGVSRELYDTVEVWMSKEWEGFIVPEGYGTIENYRRPKE